MCFFFFNDTATTEIYTLSLHDALPISENIMLWARAETRLAPVAQDLRVRGAARVDFEAFEIAEHRHHDEAFRKVRSEEHTSELQSRQYLVCRLLLEKKKTKTYITYITS